MKKIIPIMIAAAMLFAGCIVVLDTDSDATSADNGLWVYGTKADTGGNTSGTGWTYTESTNTVTLTGGTFDAVDGFNTDSNDTLYPYDSNSSFIYDGRGGETPLKIVLSGTNTVTTKDGTNSGHNHVIYSTGKIDISGTGSLIIDNTGYTDPIYAENSISISNGTITIEHGAGFGIWSMHSTVSISGGTLNLGTLGIDANGDVNISGGTINITNVDDQDLISASDGTFNMTGGTINVTNGIADDNLLAGTPGGFVLTGGELNNLKPMKWNGVDAFVECPLNEAKFIWTITAGNASISFGDPTYTVSFDANGGSGTMADVTGVSGSYTLPVCTFTAPAGKEFKCWSVADVEKNVGDSITVTANTTVKAIWQAAGTGYTVSFDANGGTGTMDKKTGVSGEYTLPESTFTAPDGKEFKCWKVGEDEKNAGDKITVSSDITVKAVWKDKSSGGNNNIGLIIGGVIAGIVVIGAVAFFLIKRP